MLNDRAAARATGFAGSALIALGGLGAGALPIGPLHHARAGLVGVYCGLALLLLAWWWYGRAARDDLTCHPAWRTLALWSAPLVIAPPMFSRDVYSYLAQGLMVNSGLDVYRYGPAVLGGLVADQVPAIWQNTPSPYGPVFLVVAESVTRTLSAHLFLGVLAMRLVAIAGVALLAWAVRVLAGSAGVNPVAATWLALLNPLVLIHLVGGAHNDALMVGLLAAGLAVAVRDRPIVATLLIAAAALVKVPAALGLVAVAVIWAARMPGRWRWLRAGGAVAVTAAGATVLITTIAGTGYGWIDALEVPISPQNWSLTGELGRWTVDALALDSVGAHLAEGLWRWAGVFATLIVAVVVWLCRARLGPVCGLGIVLVAVVIFGPAIRPWYVIWGLVPLAAAAGHDRVRRLIALLCAGLAAVVLPDGFAADGQRVLLAVVGALIGLVTFLCVRVAFAAPVRASR